MQCDDIDYESWFETLSIEEKKRSIKSGLAAAEAFKEHFKPGAEKLELPFSGRRQGAMRSRQRRGIPLGSSVYLMQIEGQRGVFKIGKSVDVLARMKQIQTGAAGKVTVPLQILVSNDAYLMGSKSGHSISALATRLEETLHSIYSEQHVRGEWFKLDLEHWDEIVGAVRPRYFLAYGDAPVFLND